MLLSRLDSNGNVLWSRDFGKSGTGDEAGGLLEDNGSLIVTASTSMNNNSPYYIGDVFKMNLIDGSINQTYTYTNTEDTSMWFGHIYKNNSGYRIYMVNTVGTNSTDQKVGFTDIDTAGQIFDYNRIVVPGADTQAEAVSDFSLPTPDGGELVGQSSNESPHIYWVKINAVNHFV